MTAPTAPLLEVDQLRVQFGGLVAVNGVDVVVRPGEIVSIIGPNGAGKTTVFNVITGIHVPTRGTVRVEGRDLARPLAGRTWLGFGAVALISAVLVALAVGIEPLWEATITHLYQYQQPFPWGQAVAEFGGWFAAAVVPRLVVPGLIGGAVGLLAAFSVWSRARRAPEVAARRGLARTFQTIRLFRKMTVLDNVLLGLDRHRHTGFWSIALRLPVYRREHRASVAQARELLRFVGLGPELDRLADQLAYGHQHRLEIARALATKPRLLLLDEPAAGLNPAETSDLMQLIRQIRAQGITILLIEHDMRVVAGISDRVLVLDHGEKIAEGTPLEICRNPQVIEAYLGKG